MAARDVPAGLGVAAEPHRDEAGDAVDAMRDAEIEGWRRAQAIFHQLLSRPEEERQRILSDACAADDLLHRKVTALLEHDASADSFLNGTLLGSPMEESLDDRPTMVGQTLGPYRIESLLARGGTSDVFLVRRTDRESEPAALKLLRDRLSSDSTVRRFLNEIRVLAGLDHPNIAHFTDVGTSDEGSPYVVVEYVEGTPLTHYCDAHRLGLAERIGLFRSVCSAVGFAHQFLVVHRDLKPANILVTDDGRVKVIDFGIAKILQPAGGDDATATVERILTPNYASPEQIVGGWTTTATDVYSLGVVLYELLSGCLPFDVRGLPLAEMAALIGGDADPPSAAFRQPNRSPSRIAEARGGTVESLRRRLEGDLDTITLHALRPEVRERYPSVEQLSEDLRRYLDGEPVLARTPSTAYRIGKLLRRHRRTFAAAAGAALLIVALGIHATVQSWRAARERDLAREEQIAAHRERSRAEAVTRLLLEAIDAATPEVARGEEITVRQLLDSAAERADEELEHEPVTHAAFLQTVATAYVQLGAFTEARALAREALALRRRALGDEHALVAESLALLSTIAGQLDETSLAEHYAEEALALRRKVLAEDHPAVASSLRQVAVLATNRNDLDSAAQTIRQALEIHRRAHGSEHPDVARDLVILGGVLYTRMELEEAEATAREAFTLSLSLYGEDHPEVATAMNLLAAVLMRAGNLGAAETLLREALVLRQRFYDEDHPFVATSLTNLGTLLLERGRFRDAERYYHEAVEIQRRLFGDDHSTVAASLASQASALTYLGELALAEPLFREAIAIYRQRHPTESLWSSETSLGVLLTLAGRFDESDQLHAAALAGRRASYGAESFEVARSLHAIGYLERFRGEYVRAREHVERALDGYRGALGADHPMVAKALHTLAEIELEGGTLDRAAALAGEALSIRTRSLEPEHPDIAANLVLRARIAQAGNDAIGARVDCEAAIALLPASFGANHWRVGDARVILADALVDSGHFRDGYDEAATAARIYADSTSPDHWRRAEAENVLSLALAGLGRRREAEQGLTASQHKLAASPGAGELRQRRAEERLRRFHQMEWEEAGS